MTEGVRNANVAALIAAALEEDGLGPAGGGDRTSRATVAEDASLAVVLRSRAAGVLAGVEVAARTFTEVSRRLDVTVVAADGDRLAPGDAVLRVTGSARPILASERTALNLLTHLSGIATLTAHYVEAVAGTGAVIRDTRKTLPGLRVLEKAAVRAGGGVNHRWALDDGLLVKDNHSAVAGGIAAATRAALAAADGRPVQIEVDDLAGLDEALGAGAASVLLDNFGLADLAHGVARCKSEHRDVFVEASGGITLGTAATIAATGVDALAVGALTHSAPALDLGLDVEG